MPSASEHNAPLALVCGEDGGLIWIGRVLATSSAALIMAGAMTPALKILLLLTTVIYWSFIESRARSTAGQPLKVYPNGRSERNGCHGQVKTEAWISGQYTFLKIKEDAGTRFVTISASRQNRNEYRKLLAWMRYQRWKA